MYTPRNPLPSFARQRQLSTRLDRSLLILLSMLVLVVLATSALWAVAARRRTREDMFALPEKVSAELLADDAAVAEPDDTNPVIWAAGGAVIGSLQFAKNDRLLCAIIGTKDDRVDWRAVVIEVAREQV